MPRLKLTIMPTPWAKLVYMKQCVDQLSTHVSTSVYIRMIENRVDQDNLCLTARFAIISHFHSYKYPANDVLPNMYTTLKQRRYDVMCLVGTSNPMQDSHAAM